MDGFGVDNRPERMKMWPPPSGEDRRPVTAAGTRSRKHKYDYLDERWCVHRSKDRLRSQSTGVDHRAKSIGWYYGFFTSCSCPVT